MSYEQLQRLERSTTNFQKYATANEKWFPDNIRERIADRYDVGILGIGERGVGKSWGSLGLAEEVDEDYINDPVGVIGDKLTFRADAYLDAILRHSHGSQLIFDEPGQEWYAREFMSQANRLIAKTMIGNRYKRFVQVYNIPVLSMIDRTARKLCQFKVDFLDRGYAEVYRIRASRFEDTEWYKRLGSNEIDKPKKKLRDAYEKHKEKVQQENYEIYHDEIVQERGKHRTDEDIMREIIKKKDKLMSVQTHGPHKGMRRLNHVLIQATFDIGRNKAERIRAKAELNHTEEVGPDWPEE